MTNITLLQSKTLPDSYLQQLCKCFQATFSYPQVTSSLSMLPAPGQPKVSPEARGHEATAQASAGPVIAMGLCAKWCAAKHAQTGWLQTVCKLSVRPSGPCLWSFWTQLPVPAGCLRVTFSQSGTRSISKLC